MIILHQYKIQQTKNPKFGCRSQRLYFHHADKPHISRNTLNFSSWPIIIVVMCVFVCYNPPSQGAHTSTNTCTPRTCHSCPQAFTQQQYTMTVYTPYIYIHEERQYHRDVNQHPLSSGNKLKSKYIVSSFVLSLLYILYHVCIVLIVTELNVLCCIE